MGPALQAGSGPQNCTCKHMLGLVTMQLDQMCTGHAIPARSGCELHAAPALASPEWTIHVTWVPDWLEWEPCVAQCRTDQTRHRIQHAGDHGVLPHMLDPAPTLSGPLGTMLHVFSRDCAVCDACSGTHTICGDCPGPAGVVAACSQGGQHMQCSPGMAETDAASTPSGM